MTNGNYPDDFIKCIEFIFKKEGSELDLDPNDIGNWTGGKKGVGELKGSKYGISARTFPDEDIANMTTERATSLIYYKFYLPNSCHILPYPLNLIHLDTAYNCGSGQAVYCLRESAQNPAVYILIRMNYHFENDSNPNLRGDFKGHMRRCLDLSLILRGKDISEIQ